MNPYVELFFSILCAERDHSPAKLRDVLDSDQWNEFARMGRQYELLPLLYYHLKQLDLLQEAPRETAAVLQRRFLSSAARNTLVYRQLWDILDRFDAAGIPVILLKGAHIASEIHGNTALRPMGDLDLLIHRGDLTRADKILTGMGFRCAEHREYFHMLHHHLGYDPPAHRIRVEMHWHILNPAAPYRVDTEGLWLRAREIPIADRRVLVLSPEDLVLHLCMHTGYDTFTMGVKPLYDIHRTLAHFHGDLDLEVLADRCRDWKAEKPVYLCLVLLEKWFNADIPEHLLRRIRPPDYSDQVLNWAEQQLSTPVNPEDPDRLPSIPLWPDAGRGLRWVGDLFRAVFPSRRFMAARYSMPETAPGMYVRAMRIRLTTLCVKLVRSLVRMLNRGAHDSVLRPPDSRHRLDQWMHMDRSSDYRA